MMLRTIYFVAGEASGDNHGAALMQALRGLDPALRFVGRGGPHMKSVAGGEFRNWIDEAAVVGLWEVIKNYAYFRRQFRETLAEISATRPDAVVLIDYPGFNLRLARALRGRAMAAPRIIYYISPQVWAWHRGRIRQMVRSVDLMLCIFPFEADLYSRSGLRARFVGHPMLERLREQKIETQRDPGLIGLFPGSRRREVRKIFPILLETMRYLRRNRPDLRFEIAAASPELASEMKTMLEHAGKESGFAAIKIGETAAIMQRAIVGVVASGSATLEAAYFRLPFVLVYKVSWLTYFAARLVVRVRHLGMPNVLAGREIVPEFIQHHARPSLIAAAVSGLLEKPAAKAQMVSSFDAIMDSLGKDGASQRAAAVILGEITASPPGDSR
jgi:lipid-A-disaccharide synthase